jgi:plastocyanin
MNKTVKIILALVVVGAVVAIALLVGGNKSDNDSNNDKNGSSNSDTAVSAATITYDGSSFSPNEVTVEKGGTVTFVNDSDSDVEPSSDNHPTHTVNPEINFGSIAPGERKTMTVNEAGEYGYHNHFSASETGVINVQ